MGQGRFQIFDPRAIEASLLPPCHHPKSISWKLPCMGEVKWTRIMALYWAILIYYPVIDNQLVELYLLFHRGPLYKVWAAPVLARRQSLLLSTFLMFTTGQGYQVPFLTSLVWRDFSLILSYLIWYRNILK